MFPKGSLLSGVTASTQISQYIAVLAPEEKLRPPQAINFKGQEQHKKGALVNQLVVGSRRSYGTVNTFMRFE